MTPLVATTLGCLGAVLLGSVPFGLLIARARGVDLRRVGSGNIGASNVARACGRSWGVAVLILDAAKGALPVLVVGASPAAALPWAAALVGVCAVLGHSFSIFLRGRGGKGVATSLGVALALAPLPALLAFAVYLLLFLPLRISSVGSLAAALSFPLLVWRFQHRPGHPADAWALGFAVAAALLIVVRHRSNIQRLVRGQELRA